MGFVRKEITVAIHRLSDSPYGVVCKYFQGEGTVFTESAADTNIASH